MNFRDQVDVALRTENEEHARDTVTVYADQRGEYRWRRRAAGNNRTLSDSGEGYTSLNDCIADAARCNFDLDGSRFQM